MTESNEKHSQYTINAWQEIDINAIYASLEVPNWAPWLAASIESLMGRVEVFSKGQLLVKDFEGNPLASLSMNKIDWNGSNNTLPCWDKVAGDPTTYENTYIPSGNTLVMMSMNVHPDHQGKGFAQKLIEQAKLVALSENVDYLIGSFRPNEYGKYKLEHLYEEHIFSQYCDLKREDGLPIDGWLRNLSRNGMRPLQEDKNAMSVTVPLEKFDEYRNSFHVDLWMETKPHMWECGEVGSWTIDSANQLATYKESNLWGIVWKNSGLES